MRSDDVYGAISRGTWQQRELYRSLRKQQQRHASVRR